MPKISKQGIFTSMNLVYLFGAIWLTYPAHAWAYVGPGLGSGVVVAVIGTVFGLLMLIVGVIWYPIKKMIRRFWPKK